MHVTLSDNLPSNTADKWVEDKALGIKVMEITLTDRSSAPVFYRDMLTRFTDNDPENCPILKGSTQIDMVLS